jgi:outer membrane receptor for ferrienterochelin and colicin
VLPVIDDMPVQGAAGPELADLQAETLLNLPPTSIESIEYLSAAEAGPKYGTGAMRGVLVIYTRGKGPYASPRN